MSAAAAAAAAAGAAAFPQSLALEPAEWRYEMRHSMQAVAPALYLGPAEAGKDLQRLTAAGITALLLLRSPHETPFVRPRFPEHFVYLVLDDVADQDTQNLIRLLPRARAFIDEQLARGGQVLVHDDGGISRAPAVVVMYLMDRYQVTFDAALAHVQARRYCMHINPGFLNQIKEFEALSRAQHSYAGADMSDAVSSRRKREMDDEDDEEMNAPRTGMTPFQ